MRIGVDITSIKRFEDKKINFIRKILSNNEFKEWENYDNKSLYVAQRWAIKEALFKVNNDMHDFNLIDIKRNNKGEFIYKGYQISTSKENEYIIAFVMEDKNND